MNCIQATLTALLLAGAVAPGMAHGSGADPAATTGAVPQAAPAAAPGLAVAVPPAVPDLAATPARASPLETRMRLLTRELSLDAGQQQAVQRILEEQRTQVQQVWRDTQVPAGRRIAATQAISERASDQIRALLSDEQKDKYLRARTEEAGKAGGKPDVAAWMKAMARPAQP